MPADLLVRLAEGNPGTDELFRGIGGQERRIGSCSGQSAAVEFEMLDQDRRRLQAIEKVVGGGEKGDLVLLQVAVIGKRQALEHGSQGDEASQGPARPASQQLGDIGVFLLGHQTRAGRDLVGQDNEAELGGRP